MKNSIVCLLVMLATTCFAGLNPVLQSTLTTNPVVPQNFSMTGSTLNNAGSLTSTNAAGVSSISMGAAAAGESSLNFINNRSSDVNHSANIQWVSTKSPVILAGAGVSRTNVMIIQNTANDPVIAWNDNGTADTNNFVAIGDSVLGNQDLYLTVYARFNLWSGGPTSPEGWSATGQAWDIDMLNGLWYDHAQSLWINMADHSYYLANGTTKAIDGTTGIITGDGNRGVVGSGLTNLTSFGAMTLSASATNINLSSAGNYFMITNYDSLVVRGFTGLVGNQQGSMTNPSAGFYNITAGASFKSFIQTTNIVTVFTNNVACGLISFAVGSQSTSLGQSNVTGSASSIIFLPANSRIDARVQSTSGAVTLLMFSAQLTAFSLP